MGGHHSVYERNESLLNHLGIRVGEGIENIGVGFDILQDGCEIWLHLAIAAYSQ